MLAGWLTDLRNMTDILNGAEFPVMWDVLSSADWNQRLPMRSLFIAPLLVALAIPAIASAQPVVNESEGLWINPHDSVVVRTSSCAAKLCGWIVWANAEALADARESGVRQLIGTELLQDYHPTNAHSWSGTVFVPDLGRNISSQINQLSSNELKIKGCILGGLICKSQLWTRIDRVPQ